MNQPVAAMSDEEAGEVYEPSQPVAVTALGMITAVGADAVQTAVSVQAGISAYKESAIRSKLFFPMITAELPDDTLPALHPDLQADKHLTFRQQRMLQMSQLALEQVTASTPLDGIPLLLAGPEKMPECRSAISDKFLEQLVIQSQCQFDMENSYVYPDGRAGALLALQDAMVMIEQGEQEQVLIGGVDSYMDLNLLTLLDLKDRILARNIRDGFVPGEGVGFVLLRAATDQDGIKLYPPGIADEPGHRFSEEPYKGEGLANAIQLALSDTSAGKVQTIIAGLNGENFGGKEWGVSVVRHKEHFVEDYTLWHPVEAFGDIGAAMVPVFIGLAFAAMQQGYIQGPILLWASSEFEQRAALYIG